MASGQYDEFSRGWLPAMAVAAVGVVGAGALGAFLVLAGSAESEPVAPLKIGIILPTSNVFADIGAAQLNAARLAINEINQDGGVLGHPVELVAADSGGDPGTAMAEARRLIDEEGVQAIISEDWDHISWQIAREVTEPAGILHLGTGRPFKRASEHADSFFRPQISQIQQGELMAALVQRAGYQNVCAVLMSDSDDTFARQLTSFRDSASGIDVRPDSYDDFLQPFGGLGGPVSSWCAGSDATAFFIWAAFRTQGPDPAPLLTEAATGDVGVLLLIDDLRRDDIMERVGWDLMDGTRGTHVGNPNEEAYRAFVLRFTGLFGALPDLPYSATFATAYDSVYLISLAAEAAASTDPVAMRDAMHAVANEPGTLVTPGSVSFESARLAISNGRDIDFEGVTGPIHFDDNGDNTRTNAAFWRVDGAAHRFVTEQQFVLDTEAGTVTESPTTVP